MTQPQTLPLQGSVAAPAPDPKAVEACGQTFRISGKLLKTASPQKVYHEDIDNPEATIRALKALPVKIDMLKFWQKIPNSEAKHKYYKEWRDAAAIPISTYEHWWKSLKDKTRNMVRKAAKKGVVISEVPFTDELVRGMMEIFNQSPIRRGKPMRHYGKSFEVVKADLGADLADSIFVAAHYENELIGFIKFMLVNEYAMVTVILDKTTHRDKAPMNGMLARVVEICAERKIPYFTYTFWRRGEHGQFQKSNGFVKIPMPEYFVPLTFKGRVALLLRLHEGLQSLLPKKVYGWLIDMRTKWNTMRYARGH